MRIPIKLSHNEFVLVSKFIVTMKIIIEITMLKPNQLMMFFNRYILCSKLNNPDSVEMFSKQIHNIFKERDTFKDEVHNC